MYSKFLFIFSATVLAAETSDGRNETLWNKLTAYKDLTGISDEEMLSIWTKSEKIKNGGGNTLPKFRAAMSKPIFFYLTYLILIFEVGLFIYLGALERKFLLSLTHRSQNSIVILGERNVLDKN